MKCYTCGGEINGSKSLVITPDEDVYEVHGNYRDCIACLRAERDRLAAALHLACTPPWPVSHGPLGQVDETLVAFHLRRASEAKGGK